MTAPIRTLVSLLFAALTAVPAAADTLRLDAELAARLAVEASSLTDAAEARVEASRSAIAAADAARLPVITAHAGVAQRSAVPEFTALIEGPNQPPVVLFPNIETTYQADLVATLPLYTGGGIAAGRDAARQDQHAASWSLELTATELRLAARVLYWRAVAAEAGLDTALAQQRRAVRLLDDARALRAAGMAVDADVFAAEARAAAAEVDVIRADTDGRNSFADLRSLLRLASDADVTLADARTSQVPESPPPLPTLQEAAIGQRQELKMSDARIASLAARERATDARRRPAVAASAQYGLARPNTRYFPLEDVWRDAWSVGVLASWQLFDGQRTRAEAATVHAESNAVRAEREELVRRIELEVETSRLEMEAALDAVAAADASQTAAEAREKASRERYGAGLAPIWEMLDAQAELTAAELAQIRTRTTAWIASAALDRAVGR